MTTFVKLLSTCLIVLMPAMSSGQEAQSKKLSRAERREQEATRVKSLVEQRSITIEIDQIMPLGGRSRNSSDGYTLIISGDTLNCYLPYFGRAYAAPIEPDQAGIVVKKQLVEIKESFSEKRGYDLQFEARGQANEIFSFAVNIGLSGSCSINVTGTNRQSISYMGKLREKKETNTSTN